MNLTHKQRDMLKALSKALDLVRRDDAKLMVYELAVLIEVALVKDANLHGEADMRDVGTRLFAGLHAKNPIMTRTARRLSEWEVKPSRDNVDGVRGLGLLTVRAPPEDERRRVLDLSPKGERRLTQFLEHLLD